MAKIVRLSPELANQIAAGEVVERPASVVKELVENALDAGASRIQVEIETGGMSRIAVSDDGAGMNAEDAVLALERHATSKIAKFEDLLVLHSFGFRGEALPSIASVSRFTLTTRERGTDEGVSVHIEGGATPEVRPVGAAPGTTIEVRELFFNVPARRKFLKATATESAHVGETVMLAALARPEVTMLLFRDGRMVREYLRADDHGARAMQAFPEEQLAAGSGERGPLRFRSFLAPPERARAGTVGLHLFVNARPVRDRALARAVAQAYGSVLEPGRYPIGVVYLELPPELVDVNVHPQKAEVRFADARAVQDALTRELHLVLAKAFSVPALGPRSFQFRAAQRDIAIPALSQLFARDASTGVGREVSADAGDVLAGAREGSEDPRDASGNAGQPMITPPGRTLVETASAPSDLQALFAGAGFYAKLRYLAQSKAMYLICEAPDGLYVIDQHAAAERVTFHRLREAYRSRGVASQRLMVPELVELSPKEMSALESHTDELSKLGLEVRATGPHAAAIHAVPTLLARARPERLLRDALAEASRDAARPFSGAVDLVLATMACHGSIRAGDAISSEEATALLASLDAVDFSGHCPHGRPVVTRLGFEELERRVGRR